MSPRKAAKTAKTPAKPEADAITESSTSAVAKPVRKPRAKVANSDTIAIPAPEPVVAEPAPKPRGRKPKAVPEPSVASADPIVEAPVSTTPVVATAALDGLTGAVLCAIQQGRAIELIFKDADANPPRTFEPRQLVFDVFSQAWFVWGWDRRYNAERHHRVDAMAEVNLVDGPGRAAQGPFAEGTPANQIGGWRGGEPILVKVQLQKQWVFAVRQAPAPFPDFTLEEGEDGKANVSFSATDLRAIARWVMQFGDGITVQEPQRLVDRVRQVAQAWGAKVAPTAPAPRPEPVREAREDARPKPASRPEPVHRREREKEHREPEVTTKGNRIEVRIDRL